jgi:hypothetical protein
VPHGTASVQVERRKGPPQPRSSAARDRLSPGRARRTGPPQSRSSAARIASAQVERRTGPPQSRSSAARIASAQVERRKGPPQPRSSAPHGSPQPRSSAARDRLSPGRARRTDRLSPGRAPQGTASAQVERAALDPGREGLPVGGGERQSRPGRVLRVAHRVHPPRPSLTADAGSFSSLVYRRGGATGAARRAGSSGSAWTGTRPEPWRLTLASIMITDTFPSGARESAAPGRGFA